MNTFCFVLFSLATGLYAWDFYSVTECPSTATQRILVGAARLRAEREARESSEVSE